VAGAFCAGGAVPVGAAVGVCRDRQCGDRFRLLRIGCRLLKVERQGAAQIGEKGLLGRRLDAVGIADADRHFEGELPRLRGRQRRHRRGHRHAFEQYILIEGSEIDRSLAGQGVGDALEFGTLGLVLHAVGEGGHQAEGENGFLLLLVHAKCLL
jgi:hypothetical protein